MVSVASGACHPKPATRAAEPTASTALPSVPVAAPDGEPTTVQWVIEGRPALINLWATWCDACKAEFAPLNRLQDQIGNRGAVVGIAVGEPRQRVIEFIRKHGLRYSQLVDEEFALADALGSNRIPTTLVVDASGAVRYRGAKLDRTALEAFQAVLTPLASP